MTPTFSHKVGDYVFNNNNNNINQRTKNVAHWLKNIKYQQSTFSTFCLFFWGGGRNKWLWTSLWKLDVLLFMWPQCHCAHNVLANPNKILNTSYGLGERQNRSKIYYMVWYGSKNIYQQVVSLQKIALCSQHDNHSMLNNQHKWRGLGEAPRRLINKHENLHFSVE